MVLLPEAASAKRSVMDKAFKGSTKFAKRREFALNRALETLERAESVRTGNGPYAEAELNSIAGFILAASVARVAWMGKSF